MLDFFKNRITWIVISIVLGVILLVLTIASFIPGTSETSWKDNDEGITVSQKSSFFDKLSVLGIDLNVEKFEEGTPEWAVAKDALGEELDSFSLFDIKLLKGGNQYNAEHKLTVTFEFSETFSKNNVVIYSISNDGQKEKINTEASLSKNAITFTTNSLSTYAIGEKPYTVKMETGGVFQIPDQKILWGGYVTDPMIAIREGYVFNGWFLGDKKWDFATNTITSDTTLVAQWTPKEYTLTLDPSGGIYSGQTAVNLTYGSAYELMSPTRKGYTFMGWFSGEERWEQSGTWNSGDNVSLTAKWEIVKYSIIYDGNGATGGSVEDPVGVSRSEENKLPLAENTFTREGYDFVGWSTQKSDGGIFLSDKSTVGYIDTPDSSSNITLYARWQGKKYTVSFDTENLGYVPEILVEYGSTYGSLPYCAKKGYTFIGWFTSKDGGTRVNESTSIIVPDDHTLYPRFELNEYTVSFTNEGGAAVSAQTALFGSTITLTSPTHTYGDYYTFVGWSDGTNTYSDTYTIVEDVSVTLRAKWEQKYADYTYIFTADDFKLHIGNNLQKSPKPDNCGAGKYMLLNDIDLGDWNEGFGYTYWASNNASTTLNGKTCFSGVFDGQSHTVTYKLRIGKTSLNSWAFGLFPVTDGATIKNLKVNADLSTYDPQNRGQKWHISNDDRAEDAMVGGLVGYANNTTIENCSVSGKVIYNSDGGGGDTCVAGVVGYAYNSTVKNCSSSAEVYARGFYVNVAGVISCYYNTSYSGLSATGNIHYNEDWLAGGHWSGNEVVKSLKVL